MSCKARVWDNGDTTDCGAASHREGSQYCSSHYATRMRQVDEAIAAAEEQVRFLRAIKDDLRRA